jgi:8-oxo-dGTP pyrophosphatase MutT (NUDIX family)
MMIVQHQMLSQKDILLRLAPLLIQPTIFSSDFSMFRAAAVLVIIHYGKIIPHIILTKRSSNLRSHANEISFPGGKYVKEDKSLIETAIRETKEEIGIDIMRRDIIGRLERVKTLTSNFIIMPFVTLQDRISEPKIYVDEIEKVIDVPLMEVLGTIAPDIDHYNLSVTEVYKFTYENEVIWGATARILKQLYDCLCINRK